MDLTTTPAWQALQSHYDSTGKDLVLRELFADDPTGPAADRRSGQPGAGLFQAPRHRRDDALLMDVARTAGVEARRTPCSQASTSTRPRTGPSSTSRCACPKPKYAHGRRPERRQATSTRSSTKWASCPTASATATGSAPRASASGPWSTSASAAPTWARHGHRGAGRRGHAGPDSRFVSNVDPVDLYGPPTTSTRPPRCSSSAPRPSPRSRR